MGLLDSKYRADFGEGETKRVDWMLFILVLIMAAIGTITLYSATFEATGVQNTFLLKQLIFFGIGFFVIALCLLFDYRILEHFAYIIYGLNILLVLGTRWGGVMRNGQKLWYNFGVVAFQPSETMKVAMILALAKYFHGREYSGSLNLRELFSPMMIVLGATVAVCSQPDPGTGMIIFLIGLAMILFFGIKKNIILTTIVAGLLMSPFVWKYGLAQRHRDRIKVVFDPSLDPKGKGYNSLQAIIAVGSGQFVGKGFNQGTQSQLGFTPEGYTDFIFTVLAEEWGWIGSFVCMILYLLLIYRCVWAAAYSREKFGAMVAIGVAAMLSAQAIVNIAMVIGLFPIVGIPLPLLSYGGSSVITVCLAIGLVLNIGYRRIMF
ncbi:MAG: rod shape-determining protein RodA [Nitrosomonas ureae]